MPTLYAPPAIPVFPAGYGPLPSDMDNWIQSPLGFQTQGIVFRAERHASQSLAAPGNTTILWDTVLEDPYSGYSSGSGEWTAPYSGYYAVSVTIVVTPGLGANIGAGITTIETVYKTSAALTSSALAGGASAAQLVPAVGGVDYIAGFGYSSSGSTITTSTVNGLYSSMEISFVSQ
jgi:hypothetical protein